MTRARIFVGREKARRIRAEYAASDTITIVSMSKKYDISRTIINDILTGYRCAEYIKEGETKNLIKARKERRRRARENGGNFPLRKFVVRFGRLSLQDAIRMRAIYKSNEALTVDSMALMFECSKTTALEVLNGFRMPRAIQPGEPKDLVKARREAVRQRKLEEAVI